MTNAVRAKGRHALGLSLVLAVLAPGMAGARPRLSSVHEFSPADGVALPTSVIQGRDGAFYGTATYPNLGTLFRFDPQTGQVTAVPLALSLASSEPQYPSRLVQARDGSFYGTTQRGGAFGGGTAFRWTLPNTVTVLHAFPGGAFPAAALVEADDGSLWGTTFGDGACGGGTTFRITPAGVVTTLHAFGCQGDGALPAGPLVPAGDGSFFGATLSGGREGLGTVFRVSASGVVTLLHEFATGEGAAHPAALTLGPNGLLYGSGAHGIFYGVRGGVFAVTADGRLAFAREGPPIKYPLVAARDGNLYGVSRDGAGEELFRFSPTGQVTTLLNGLPNESAAGGLIEAADGVLYGVLTQSLSPANVPWGEIYRVIESAAGDFTGDAAADVTVYRPSNGTWYTRPAAGTTAQGIAWGAPGDVPAPGDYDGDGLADAAVYRPSTATWWIRYSGNATFTTIPFGTPGDLSARPVPADYDSDGKANVALFTAGTWQTLTVRWANPTRSIAWGNGDDIPVPGDYDGDGFADAAVYRPSEGVWYLTPWWGFGAARGVAWGAADDRPVPGDYDGDGTTDVAVYRPNNGTWYIVPSSTGVAYGVAWGNATDVPVPGDYDGDDRTDLAVFRPATGTWYIRFATGAATGLDWGNANDVPLKAAY